MTHWILDQAEGLTHGPLKGTLQSETTPEGPKLLNLCSGRS